MTINKQLYPYIEYLYKYNYFKSNYYIHEALIRYLINSRYEEKKHILQLSFQDNDNFQQFKTELKASNDLSKLQIIQSIFNTQYNISNFSFETKPYKENILKLIFKFNIQQNNSTKVSAYMTKQRLEYIKKISQDKCDFYIQLIKIIILFYAFKLQINNQQLSILEKNFKSYAQKGLVFEMFASPINSFSLNYLYANNLPFYKCYCSIFPNDPYNIGDATSLYPYLKKQDFKNKIITVFSNPPYTETLISLAFNEVKKIYNSTNINAKELYIVVTCPYWKEEDHQKNGFYYNFHNFVNHNNGTFTKSDFIYYDTYYQKIIHVDKPQHKTAQWVLHKIL